MRRRSSRHAGMQIADGARRTKARLHRQLVATTHSLQKAQGVEQVSMRSQYGTLVRLWQAIDTRTSIAMDGVQVIGAAGSAHHGGPARRARRRPRRDRRRDSSPIVLLVADRQARTRTCPLGSRARPGAAHARSRDARRLGVGRLGGHRPGARAHRRPGTSRSLRPSPSRARATRTPRRTPSSGLRSPSPARAVG